MGFTFVRVDPASKICVPTLGSLTCSAAPKDHPLTPLLKRADASGLPPEAIWSPYFDSSAPNSLFPRPKYFFLKWHFFSSGIRVIRWREQSCVTIGQFDLFAKASQKQETRLPGNAVSSPPRPEPSEREIKMVVSRWVRDHRQRSEEFRRTFAALFQAEEAP